MSLVAAAARAARTVRNSLRGVTGAALSSHTSTPARAFSSGASSGEGDAERALIRALSEGFPGATDIVVVDVSGGCGAMYEVHVEAPQFKGLRTVGQHKLVTEVLKEQIKDMHGLRISTAVSESKD